MGPIHSFRAPWGRLLIVMTFIGCAALIGIPVLTLSVIPANETPPVYVKLMMMILFPLILLITALFTIRSFDICQDAILVKRLFWSTRLPYEGLRSVVVDPEAMKGSIRTMGNGGLFSFSGRYRSKKLGSFRALAMDLKLSVILRYESRTIVVTPEDPGQFASLVKQFSGAE